MTEPDELRGLSREGLERRYREERARRENVEELLNARPELYDPAGEHPPLRDGHDQMNRVLRGATHTSGAPAAAGDMNQRIRRAAGR